MECFFVLSSRIVACGSFLPEKILSNDEITTFLDTSDAWISERTGIKSRHIISKHHNTSDLATFALSDALNSAKLGPEDLDGIVLATTTPDLVFPSTAVQVQSKILMPRGFAFDVQAVCSGFLYALSIAHNFIISGSAKRIAVIGAESMSRILDWNDRSTCILFGDGAGCVILEKSDTIEGILEIQLFSDMNTIDLLKVDGGVSKGNLGAKLQMSGREVFRIAVLKMCESFLLLLEKLNIPIEALDWFIPHQANSRILSAVAAKLELPTHKIVSTIATHGNTSAASIPLALDSYVKSGRIKPGQLIGMSAVGAGMTWASGLIRF